MVQFVVSRVPLMRTHILKFPLFEHFATFSTPIANAGSCVVCREMISNAAVQVQLYIDLKKKKNMTSLEVEEYLLNICNPYTSDGSWIRRIAFFALPETSHEGSPLQMVVSVLREPVYSKRACATVAFTCESIVDSAQFDTFAKHLADLTLEGSVMRDEVVQQLAMKYCPLYDGCSQANESRSLVNEMLNDHSQTARDDMEEDPLEIIPKEEYYKEFLTLPRESAIIEPFTPEELKRMNEIMQRHSLNLTSAEETVIGTQDAISPEAEKRGNGRGPVGLSGPASVSQNYSSIRFLLVVYGHMTLMRQHKMIHQISLSCSLQRRLWTLGPEMSRSYITPFVPRSQGHLKSAYEFQFRHLDYLSRTPFPRLMRGVCLHFYSRLAAAPARSMPMVCRAPSSAAALAGTPVPAVCQEEAAQSLRTEPAENDRISHAHILRQSQHPSTYKEDQNDDDDIEDAAHT
eukprot:gene6735-4829_t